MPQQFPKDITDAMRNCILAIFWPKKDIIDFFKSCGCTNSDLRSVTQQETVNRAEIVDLVFSALHGRTDGGVGQFRAMLKALTEWNHFDPYFFQTLRKLDEQEAKRRITHLSQIQEIRDAKIKTEREAAAARAAEAAERAKAKSLDQLKDRFLNLFRAKQLSHQQRGYEFEQFLRELSEHAGLSVTEPFRIHGEQIDGAIKYDGEHYIIEAKWHDKLIASDALYQFAYKVEGKMYGRGFFFSVNGFSTESVEQLVMGKTLRTILIDGADLTMVVEGRIPFATMLDMKVKAAQTSGLIYFDPIDNRSKI
ncbi:restriction endonuclease [Alicyclobacillus tolerans]|uniref:restriction endonuclease n=1 Tax=Alicyclobacillus tolerans TaxID=90970 RepID=UPI003B7F6306